MNHLSYILISSLEKGREHFWGVFNCSEDIQVSSAVKLVEARIQIPNQYLSYLKYAPYN